MKSEHKSDPFFRTEAPKTSKTGVITSITEGKTKLLQVFSQRQTFSSNAVFNRWNGKEPENPADVIQKTPENDTPDAFGGDGLEQNIPQLDSHFELKRKIGEGGYSEIYEAYDNVLKRIVAIKTLIHGSGDKPSRRRAFITEARATAYLDHPNIVPVHGIFMDQNRNLYLSMKLIKGLTLKMRLQELIARYKHMPKMQIREAESQDIPERLRYFLKVCDAIAYAHHKHVIHRDLKPENIMIGDFSEVYVMDWGLAEHRDININKLPAGHTAGTLKYMAPEIMTYSPYDSRSDLFSLGSILFETVFLRPLFEANAEEDLCQKILSGECAPMRHLYGAPVPKELKTIIRKAVQTSPGARYQTVQMLIRDLQKCLYNGNSDGFGWF